MSEDETTFLCGYRRPRKYGTTSGVSIKPSYSNVIHHKVCESDTIQGLALRYGSSMTEIKRLNKLWSNDSVHLKETLIIPVYLGVVTASNSGLDVVTSSASDSGETSGAVPNGIGYQVKNRRSASEANTPESCVDKLFRRCSHQSPRSANTPFVFDTDKSDSSVSDLLNKIDLSIKATTKNVKKLERESTIDKVLEQADSGFSASSGSVQSFQNILRTRSPSPTEVRTERRGNDIPMEQIRQARDKFCQL